MKILLPNKDINILLNQDVSFKNDAGWSENFSEFENDALEQIINPIENYETIRYINKPYSGLTTDPNVNQTDIWFYFYFLSGTTYVPSYEPTGLSNKANSLLMPSTTESFFRLEFYKTPNDELPDNTNRRLVATKTLKIPLSEKFFLTKDNFNKYVHIPIFHGSNYENSENMYFFWFEDDSVLDETNISGNTFWMTARYFNSVDGSVIAFTNNCMSPVDDVIESRDLYYKVVIDKTDYSYKIFDFYGSLGTRTGFLDKPVAFYEIGGGNCNNVYQTEKYTSTPTITPTITSTSNGNTTTFSLSVQPYSDTEFLMPARGVEHWINTPWNDTVALTMTYKDPVTNVVTSGNTHSLDKYVRFNWNEIETDVKNVYDWTIFDNNIENAMSYGGKFSFSVMMAYDSHDIIPQWFIDSGYTVNIPSANIRVPKWNSPEYLDALTNLLTAINTHLYSKSYNGIPYWKAISYIDIRGYGNFGEWHSYSSYDYHDEEVSAGIFPDANQFKAIVNANLQSLPNFQQIVLVGSTSAQSACGWCHMPDEFVGWLFFQSTNAGKLGLRIDHLGDNSGLEGDFDKDSSYVYNSVTYSVKDLRNEMWKYGIHVGEPDAFTGNTIYDGVLYGYFEQGSIINHHFSSFGNGNFWSVDLSNPSVKTSILNAAKRAGYRVIISGGTAPNTIENNQTFTITTNWINQGVAPVYEYWDIYYELRDISNNVVWSQQSSKDLRLYLPENNLPETSLHTWTDNNLIVTSVPSGTYSLNIIIKDPTEYRDPFVLANYNRTSYGGYILLNNVTVI